MSQEWKDIMNCLLGVVLYHGRLPEEASWCEQYNCEIRNMMIWVSKHNNYGSLKYMFLENFI